MDHLRKHILFVVPFNPLLGSKGAQGPKNVSQPLIGLVAAAHEVILAVVSDDPTLSEAVLMAAFPQVRGVHICRPVSGWARRLWRLRFLLQGLPPSLADSIAASLAALLREQVPAHDLVHFEYFTLAPYIAAVQRHKPVALHCHDAYSLYQQRCLEEADGRRAKLLALLRRCLFQRLEGGAIASCAAAMTVSPVDQRYLALAGLANVRYLPPALREVSMLVPPERHSQPVELLCVVPATYQPSQLRALRALFREVLPGLAARYPGQLSITLFGKTAARLQRELPAIGTLQAVEFVDDYFGFLGSRNWVYLYPQRAGAGLHTKVRDAMTAELPVVGYAEIMNAFSGHNWQHYVACDCDAAVGEALDKLFASAALRRQIGLGGKALLAQRFGPAHVINSLNGIYAGVCNGE